MSATAGDTQLFFGPQEFGAPDALLTPIVDTISRARDDLVVATQQLEHRAIVNALAIARRRGVDVRVLLERDYIRESRARDAIWAPGGSYEGNREALAALYRASIHVRVERRSRLMHHNFIVADAKTDAPVVVSTSANLTPRGLHRHLNHLLLLRDGRIAAAFIKEFESIWQDELESPHAASPSRVAADEMSIKVLFGPEHDPEAELTSQIQRAERSILFSISSFSTGSTIDDALTLSSKRGVHVLGVMDGTQAQQRWAATDVLERAGTSVHFTEELFPAKLHHKLMVLDDATICIGTFNYSVSAARSNEEVVIVLAPRGSTSPSALPGYAKREVLRIQHAFAVSASRLLGG